MQTDGKKQRMNDESKVVRFFKGIGQWFVNLFVTIGSFFAQIGRGIARFWVNVYKQFINGGWRTKLSHFIMGIGHIFMERPIKGIIYLLIQVGYFVFMFIPNGGIYWLSKFGTLGTKAMEMTPICIIPGVPVEDCHPDDIVEKATFLDDSMLIMLFSMATIIVTIFFLVVYFVSVKGAYKAETKYEEAKKEYASLEIKEGEEKPAWKNPLPTFLDELKSLLNHRFHFTTLSIPTITISIFTVLPLAFMIMLAFTNFNKANGPPNTLFTWVGLQTFKNLFSTQGSASFGSAMFDILQWTFIWAFFATFTNYIFGLILAMIINRRSIKAKKLWRTIFVITIAVPQFVTLLLMSQLLKEYGPLNEELMRLGWITSRIKFLNDPILARVSVILVNIWVGVPYTMLITSGILMNIPTDLYESARIDGAGPVRQFMKITLPYMLFVTGPYLITQFVGNINNFNVIFFLTQGGPSTGQIGVPYGHTDILVTWLYALTVGGDRQEYAIGSALGIFIFLISATITLVLYSRTAAAQQEGDFA